MVKKTPSRLWRDPWIRWLLVISGGFLVLVITLVFALSLLIRAKLKDWPEHLSKQISEALEEQFPKDAGREPDPRIVEHLNGHLERMRGTPRQDHPSFSITVQCTKEKNAFALPNGRIVVFSGLLPALRNDGELALLLGHEMAHLLHRDYVSQVKRNLLAGLAFAFLAGGSDEESTQILLLLGNWLIQNKFNRTQEFAADTLGLDLVHEANFNTYAAVGLYDSLSKEGGEQIPEFLLTHPASGNRKQALKEHIFRRGWQWQVKEEPPLPEYFSTPCRKIEGS